MRVRRLVVPTAAVLALTVLFCCLQSTLEVRTAHSRLRSSLIMTLTVVPDSAASPPAQEPVPIGRLKRTRPALAPARAQDVPLSAETRGISASINVASESPAQALRRAQQPTVVPAEWRHRRHQSFRRYIDLHAAILAGKHARRYLVVQPCCQLCNRVRVLVSALALGMLTERAVLMDFDGRGSSSSDYYGRFSDLFDSPLRVQSTRTPRELRGANGDERSLQWLDMMSDFICHKPLSWDESVLVVQVMASDGL